MWAAVIGLVGLVGLTVGAPSGAVADDEDPDPISAVGCLARGAGLDTSPLGLPCDRDGDGFTPEQGDCDDSNPSIHPGASDDTSDGIDNDCDGSVDEDVDADGDGFTVADGDCDDMDASTYPGAPEQADGVDNDCDGVIDEGIVGPDTYRDADGDGFGDPWNTAPATSQSGSWVPQPGYVWDSTDCDDQDSSTHPGAPEQADGVDNDCDGVIDEGT